MLGSAATGLIIFTGGDGAKFGRLKVGREKSPEELLPAVGVPVAVESSSESGSSYRERSSFWRRKNSSLMKSSRCFFSASLSSWLVSNPFEVPLDLACLVSVTFFHSFMKPSNFLTSSAVARRGGGKDVSQLSFSSSLEKGIPIGDAGGVKFPETISSLEVFEIKIGAICLSAFSIVRIWDRFRLRALRVSSGVNPGGILGRLDSRMGRTA